MSGIILCRSKYSKKAYYIASAGINVYSLEEIDYYLYNNIFVVGREFFCQELYDFIENDIGEEELAQELKSLELSGADTAELVIAMLQYVDYYTQEEIENVIHIMEQIDSQNNHERMKCRGDAYLSGKRYNQAILCYRGILDCGYEENAQPGFYGKVWFNLGTAYARMMEFSDASVCFMKAYEILNDEPSYAAYYDALVLGGAQKKSIIGKNELASSSNELVRVMQLYEQAGKSEEYSGMAVLAELKKQGKAQEYSAKKREIINRWKNEYRGYMR